MQLKRHTANTTHEILLSLSGEQLETTLDQLDQLITDLIAEGQRVPDALSDIYNIFIEASGEQ